MPNLNRAASHDLFENGVKKCRKRKSDADEIVDPGTSYVEKSSDCGISHIEITALSLPDNDPREVSAPLKKRKVIHQISIEKAESSERLSRGDASNYSVYFRDVDANRRDICEIEHDLRYEKLLRKPRIWRKILPSFNDEKTSTDPEDMEKSAYKPHIFPPFLSYAIAKDIGLKSAIFLKIRSLLLYLLFMFFLIFAAFGNFSTETYFFTEAVSSIFMKNCIYYNSEGQANSFEGISNVLDLMCFVNDCLKGGLSRGLWGQVRKDSGVVLLTTPRFRQVRALNQTCLLSLYGDVVCHDFFSEANESKEKFGTGDDTTGFVYRRNPDGDIWFRGYYTKYNAHGYSFLISQKQDYASFLSQGWVDDATSAIFIDFTLYSSDSNLFCVVQFLFESPPTGRMKPSFTSRAVFLMRYHGQMGHFLLFTEIMFAVLNFLNSVQIVINLIYLKCRYFRSIGLLYNLATSVLCWYAVYYLTVRYFAVDTFFNTRFGRDVFVDFQPILREHVLCDSIVVLACFFASFRLYGFLNFDLMGHLKITLVTCFKNIVVYAIAFTIIVWAFVQVANLLFGHSLERYRTFSRCFSELMKVMLGDLDYEGPSSILSLIGPIFILIYVIFVVFVFINMFFAIINGTFTFVANNVEIEEESYSGFLAHCWRTIRRKGRRSPKAEEKKVKNSERIRNLLLESAYSNMEIRIFFCRYLVDDAQALDEAVFEKLWNLRIPPERLDELKVLVDQLGNAVDLLLLKSNWLSQRIRHVKEARSGKNN